MDFFDKVFKKSLDETFEDYCHRISSLKEECDLTWNSIANIINGNTGNNYSEDKYRKQEKRYNTTIDKKQDAADLDIKEEVYNNYSDISLTTNYEKGETASKRNIIMDDEQIKDSRELLIAHGFNPDEWTIKSATNSQIYREGLSGNTHAYTSRIVVKPKESIVSIACEVAKELNNYNFQKHSLCKIERKPSGENLVIPLYDLHWGRLPDSAGSSFNIEEEKNRIISHIYKYVEKFKDRFFDEVYLILGQDFLNSSFTGYTSSQSHLQSNAVDFKTMFKTGSELLIEIIEIFRKMSGEVAVIGSLGNHDTSEEIALFELLKAYYRHDEEVYIDADVYPRKYYEIGNACVGFGHADKENKRIFGLMQHEAKDIWARTKSHIFIAGHLHSFSVDNENGVELYRVPTICPLDKWTVEQGYTMNEPKTMAFVFDDEDGLIENHFIFL